MVLRLKMGRTYATIVSAYAPTMTRTDEAKDCFHEELVTRYHCNPQAEQLILLGVDHALWPNVLGKHGLGKCNSNGELLLSNCASHELFKTSTAFYSNKYKESRINPRSKH